MTKLTKRIVDALEMTGKDHIIWDSQLSGFGIRVSPKGRKTFVVQYRHHGKSKKVRLVAFPLITIGINRYAKIIMRKLKDRALGNPEIS